MRIRAALFALIILLVSLTPSHAQQSNLPLVLQMSGDYWTWSEQQLQQRTNWGYNQDPVLAPNGQLIAYKATAQLAVDAMKRKGSTAAGNLPANIWLLDVATGAPTRINDQPTDAAFQAADKPDKFALRSTPSWSPDSQALAWVEMVVDKGNAAAQTQQLVVYNVAQRTQTVIVPDLPSQPSATTPLKIAWGNPGIAVWTIYRIPDANGKDQVQDVLALYSPDGKPLSTVKIASLYEFAWIKDGDKDYIAILANGPENAPLSEPQWLLVNPTNGQIAGMPGVPELYSLLAPGGLSLYPSSIGTLPDWQIAGVGKLGSIDDVYAFTHVLGISPDGQQIAYVKQGAAYVFTNGTTTKIAPSDVHALAWGPVGWRIRHKGLGQ